MGTALSGWYRWPLCWHLYWHGISTLQMMRESEGRVSMEKIASHVRRGAMSYLKQQQLRMLRHVQPMPHVHINLPRICLKAVKPYLPRSLFQHPSLPDSYSVCRESSDCLSADLSSGFVLAIFMANAGGAWDNAKKFVEEGNFGGKGSEVHRATVVGDTVGNPFKDTSGPSLNILIKLMSMVAIVMAGLTVSWSLF